MMSLRLPEVVAAASAVSISFDCAAVGCAPRPPVAPSIAAAPIAADPAIRPRRVGEGECGLWPPVGRDCCGSGRSSVGRIGSDTVVLQRWPVGLEGVRV